MPYYSRPASFSYLLRSHPSYWFHVGNSDEIQLLMGLLETEFYVLFFDQTGTIVDVRKSELFDGSALARETIDPAELREVVENHVLQVRKEYGLVDDVIKVKRFWLPEISSGVVDLPDDLHEYISNRDSTGLELNMEEALDGWREQDLFILYWGQDFYVDANGFVTSS